MTLATAARDLHPCPTCKVAAGERCLNSVGMRAARSFSHVARQRLVSDNRPQHRDFNFALRQCACCGITTMAESDVCRDCEEVGWFAA